MKAVLALAVAVASAQATVVSYPYSLSGTWATSMISPAESGVVGPFSGCYVSFTSNATFATWSQICQNIGTVTEEVVSTVTIPVPTVVACGQNQQLGTSYGVIGGYFAAEGIVNQTAVCVAFNRIDSDHLTNSENAEVNFLAFVPESCDAQFPGQVCCPSSPPALATITPPSLPLRIDGQYLCQSGVCDQVQSSSYCADSSNFRVKQIGVGMSVGGIGLLLVTLALILVISNVVQG